MRIHNTAKKETFVIVPHFIISADDVIDVIRQLVVVLLGTLQNVEARRPLVIQHHLICHPHLQWPQGVIITKSVGDPEPDPNPLVFVPPGSGFISQRSGSGSGSRSFPFLIKVLSRLKYKLAK
jgi:hypothetical protein